MIKSMTGFGRCEVAEAERKITVEMKSVNHRYLDVSMKMPKKLNFFEASIRGLLKEYIQRGKVDLFISYEDFTESGGTVRYNREIAAEYLKYLKRMEEDFSLKNGINTVFGNAVFRIRGKQIIARLVFNKKCNGKWPKVMYPCIIIVIAGFEYKQA